MTTPQNDNGIEGLLPAPISRRLIEVGYARAAAFHSQCRAASPPASPNEVLAWTRQMRQDVQRHAVETLAEMVDFENEFDPADDIYFQLAIDVAQHGADRFFHDLKARGRQ